MAGLGQLTLHRNIVSRKACDKTARLAESDQNEFVAGLWGRVRLKFVVGAIRERNKWFS